MNPLTDALIEASYPLVPMQQGMCFHSLYAPEEGLYLQQIITTLNEALDLERFRAAWQQVIARHAVLRSAFDLSDPTAAQQIIYRSVTLPLHVVDWRDRDPAEHAALLRHWLAADRQQGFTYAQAPLLRLTVIHCGAATDQIIWSFHHAILDGRSFQTVLSEVWQLYDHGLDAPLDPPPEPYRSFAERLHAPDWSHAEAFWREQLHDLPAPVTLGRPQPAPVAPIPLTGVQIHCLSSITTTALQTLAKQHDLTLNTLVQGAWALLLSRSTGEAEVVFGATRAGRHAPQLGPEAVSMVGLLINTLPVRVNCAPDQRLIPWLKQLRTQAIAMRPYEHTPLVQIQPWSSLPPGTPLFTSLLVYEHQSLGAQLQAQAPPGSTRDTTILRQVNYPLTLSVTGGPPLHLQLEHDRRTCDDGFALRLLERLVTLLEAFVAQPEAQLGAISALSRAERTLLLETWNATASALPDLHGISQLLEQQAAQTPDALALCDYGPHLPSRPGEALTTLTYAELHARANQLAHYLQTRGVGPGVCVALALPRSPELVIATLATLKAGGAFLPLALDYPAERLAFMLRDAQPHLLITADAAPPTSWYPPSDPVQLCILADAAAQIAQQPTTPLPCRVSLDDPAYIIYTSGSTGQPKGTLLPQRGLINLSMAPLGLDASDRVLQFAAFSFDAAVWELVMALSSGAALVLSRPEVLTDPQTLYQLLQAAQISAVLLPPLVLEAMSNLNLPALRLLIAGGERCPQREVARWAPGRRMLNAYGPTEATVCATIHVCDPADPADPPIGRPLANVQAYLLDRAGQPVPLEAPGELYVGGAGLALGYLKRPELTADRFVQWQPDPAAAPIRLYRTGDQVRYRPDGSLEFLGRLDQQLKLRGHRVEPGEVAALLHQHPAVSEVAVVGQRDPQGAPRLVAYVVASDPPAASSLPAELWAWLPARLPSYMLPAAIVPLAMLPRTPSGKLDERALPTPETAQLAPSQTAVAPRTPTEQALATLWATFLHRTSVGIHDRYVTLGGHSLLAAQIVAQIRLTLGVTVPIRTLFELETVARLAAYVEAQRWTRPPEAVNAWEEQGEI